MTHRRRMPTPGAPLLTAGLAALVAVGCGGGSNGSSGDCGGGSSTGTGPLTKEGTTLEIGKPAIFAYHGSTLDGRKVSSKIAVTPETLEKGSSGDLDGAVPPSEEESTPYYVEVCVNNVGSGDLSKTDPTDELSGTDERGESQTPIFFVNGDFDRCNPEDEPASLKPGESFATCLPFLVPKGGGSLAKVTWLIPDVTWKP